MDETLLNEEAERALFTTLLAVEPKIAEAVASHHYNKAYELLAELQPPLAKLFDEVRILDDDEAVKCNRIGMLQRVFKLFETLLDFSKLQEHSKKPSKA